MTPVQDIALVCDCCIRSFGEHLSARLTSSAFPAFQRQMLPLSARLPAFAARARATPRPTRRSPSFPRPHAPRAPRAFSTLNPAPSETAQRMRFRVAIPSSQAENSGTLRLSHKELVLLE